jgi:two-component system, LytTR family, response regulator
MAYRAVLVDDENLAIKRLQRLLRDEPAVEVVGTAENGRKAIELVEELKPDILFLDIQMPGLTGFDVIRKLRHVPVVIFTTAYDEYALQAFETSAVDYLLKPIEKARLQKAIEKLRRLRSGEGAGDFEQRLDLLLKTIERKEAESFLTHIPAKIGERILIFGAAEIAYFYASDKYTFLVTGEKEYIIDRTLAELQEKLDPARFVRIHRSAIVNVDKVKEIASLIGGRYLCRLKNPPKDLPVSRSMVKSLRQVLGF